MPGYCRGRNDGHVLRIDKGKSFEEQRESAFRPNPRDRHEPNPLLRAYDTRDARVQLADMLEEIEMPPLLLSGIMDRQAVAVALWTEELASTLKIYGDVKSGVLFREL